MAEHDDEVSRRYRTLAREEPPGALDEAILAASRRAVSSRPRRNWAVPASIAAVLVLGIGVSLRMQLEQPGIETSMPQSEYSLPQSAEAPSVAQAPAKPSPPSAEAQKRDFAPEAKRVEPAMPLEKRMDAARPVEKLTAAPDAPAAPRKRQAASEPQAFPDSAAAGTTAAIPAAPARVETFRAPAPAAVPAAPAPASPPAATLQRAPAELAAAAPPPAARAQENDMAERRAERPAARLASPPMAKREALGDLAARDATRAKDAREEELERIARLRREGRHGEADKALEEFRRVHPDYRIAPEVWERVKPR